MGGMLVKQQVLITRRPNNTEIQSITSKTNSSVALITSQILNSSSKEAIAQDRGEPDILSKLK